MEDVLTGTPLPSLEKLLAENPLYLDGAVTEDEAAKIVGRSKFSLQTMRCRGGGPAFIKHGRHVRYIRRDLLTWLASHRHLNTTEAA